MWGFLAMLCFAAPIVLWRFDENTESSYRHVWHKAQRQVEEETEAAEAEKKVLTETAGWAPKKLVSSFIRKKEFNGR